MRAAAPYQKSRRLRNPNKSIVIEENDFRAKLLQKKAGALVIFLVDASGSMAIEPLASTRKMTKAPAFFCSSFALKSFSSITIDLLGFRNLRDF